MKIRRAVAYARDRRGRLAITLTKDWNGEPCLRQFPIHIQKNVLHQPMMLEPGDAEKIWVARHQGQQVQDAVFDDIQCTNATALLILEGWDTDFQRAAEEVFVRGALEKRVHSHKPNEPLAVRLAGKDKAAEVQSYNAEARDDNEQSEEEDLEHDQGQGF